MSAGLRRLHLGSVLAAAGAIAPLVVAGFYGDYYWTIGRFLVSTDDAYVQAHSVLISPKVSGYISEVPVDDNQSVKAGEVLARIDPRDYWISADSEADRAFCSAASQRCAGCVTVVLADQRCAVEAKKAFPRWARRAAAGRS
jgi:membrane fusion protein (multidrug efflux system)